MSYVLYVGGIEIDISLNQTTGIPAVKIIKRYLDYLPALRPLVIIIKSYLNQRGMNEVYKGGLGSYSIILMAISFLQARSGFLSHIYKPNVTP
jgi:non-canonical poly(A) RNA polymerase PAPD5/7